MIDYQKVLKSRNLRRRLLTLFAFVPDKFMLILQYKLKTGRFPQLENPKRYTEKIQWYKLYYKNPLLPSLVDKYDVKDFIKAKGLGNILVSDYGVFESFDSINWESLPNRFVIKDTLGGGGNSVIIVKDKNRFLLTDSKKYIKKWLQTNYTIKSDGREWPYYSGKSHRILIEEYLDSKTGLTDYKFFCFAGKIACVYVIGNRVVGEHGELAIMDENFHRLPYQSKTQATMKKDPVMPPNFERMKDVARTLSKDFPHVRVDLYNVDGKIYFGELTFYGASGYQQFEPDEFDYKLGEYFELKNIVYDKRNCTRI